MIPWNKIRVKVDYSTSPPRVLRADGDYSKKDYADMRYAIIDLNTAEMGIGIDKGKTPSQICKDNNAEIGGNFLFAFKDDKGKYVPMGNVVKNGQLIQTTTTKWSEFILPYDGIPYIGQLDLNNIKDKKLAATSTPQIVKDGKIFINTWAEQTPNNVKQNMRSKNGIGITKDGKIIFAVLDESPYDKGFRIDEFALFLIYLGAWNAIEGDSGDSPVFYAEGKVQNYVARIKGERALGSAVYFKSKSIPIIQKPIKIVKDILGIYPKKYKVYISPSTQQWNIGVDGYVEEFWMHKIADKMEEILISYGIEVKKGRKEQSLEQMVVESNGWKPDIHFAPHSDAEDKGTARGATGFYYDGSSKSKKLCEYIYEEVSLVTPAKDRGIKPGNHLYELRKTNAPACLIENSFHTNNEDAEYITTHYIEFAEASCKGILKYFNINF